MLSFIESLDIMDNEWYTLISERGSVEVENKIMYKGTELIIKVSEDDCLGEIYFNEDFGYTVVGLQDLGSYSLQALANEDGNLFENKKGLEIALLLSMDWERMFELEQDLYPVSLEDIEVLNKHFKNNKRREGVVYLFQNMEGINKIENINEVEVGNYAYSNYTRMWYVITELPDFIKNGTSVFALVRLDGQGYFLKRESLQGLLIALENETGVGEIELFERLICH